MDQIPRRTQGLTFVSYETLIGNQAQQITAHVVSEHASIEYFMED